MFVKETTKKGGGKKQLQKAIFFYKKSHNKCPCKDLGKMCINVFSLLFIGVLFFEYKHFLSLFLTLLLIKNHQIVFNIAIKVSGFSRFL